MNPKSHPLAACVILGLAALIGSVLLMSEYLGEWPFVVLLSLGLAGSVIAYIDGDFRMLKAGPSGVELERYATQAIGARDKAVDARDEAVELAKIVARVAAFDAFGDPKITHHGPHAKLRIAYLEHILTELKQLGSVDEEAELLLQLLREIEAGVGGQPDGTEGQSPETSKELDDYWVQHYKHYNDVSAKYFKLLETRTGRKDLADAARHELEPWKPKYQPKQEDA